jgi:transposase
MNQIEQIKELNLKGKTNSEIAELLKIDPKTVRKYTGSDDFSPGLNAANKAGPSKLDKWKNIIDTWQEEDRRMRYKQRHTAKRIHQRLLSDYSDKYDCSYTTVQRYCKSKAEEKNNSKGNLELIWHNGEAQADFGEADFIDNGIKTAKKYLCLSFPSSNAGYLQIFGGENAECVVQGLMNIFNHIQGVPVRIVFDNATGIGRRFRDQIKLSELFMRFKCHYGFEATFCNPYSGHEKGNVENKVGYMRRNFFVPIPEYESIEKYNQSLFILAENDMKRLHYKKQKLIQELFEEEKKALSPLPVKSFKAIRFEKIKTDGYGKFCLDAKHWYSTSPDYAEKEVVIEIGAHNIRAFAVDGRLITVHTRKYGLNRTDTIDWSTSVARLLKNPGSWRNSGIRETIPEELRNKIDGFDREQLKASLRVMKNLSKEYSFETGITAMTQAAKNGCIDNYSTMAIAARMNTSGLGALPSDGPDLFSYDELLQNGGKHA